MLLSSSCSKLQTLNMILEIFISILKFKFAKKEGLFLHTACFILLVSIGDHYLFLLSSVNQKIIPN